MTTRRVQRRVDNDDSWEEVDLKKLHKGEIFRMYEPDGEPVKDTSGSTEFIAASDPYRVSHLTNKMFQDVPEPVWGIEIVANPGF